MEARRRKIMDQQIEARFAAINEDAEPVDVVERKLQVFTWSQCMVRYDN